MHTTCVIVKGKHVTCSNTGQYTDSSNGAAGCNSYVTTKLLLKCHCSFCKDLRISVRHCKLWFPRWFKDTLNYIHHVCRSHTTVRDIRYSSGWVISSSQSTVPDNNYKRWTSMPPVGFEPTIPAVERVQSYALDCTATVTGKVLIDCNYCHFIYYIAKSIHHVSPKGSWDF